MFLEAQKSKLKLKLVSWLSQQEFKSLSVKCGFGELNHAKKIKQCLHILFLWFNSILVIQKLAKLL
jgi:hypothetical protein